MEIIKPTPMLVSNDKETWVIRLVFAVYPDDSCMAYDAKSESEFRKLLQNNVTIRPISWNFKREIETIEKTKVFHKVALLSDGTAERGKRIIEHLESLGGINTEPKLSGCDNKGYYAIIDDGVIHTFKNLPYGYELIELPYEEKSYAITEDSEIKVGDILEDLDADKYKVLDIKNGKYLLSEADDFEEFGGVYTLEELIDNEFEFCAEEPIFKETSKVEYLTIDEIFNRFNHNPTAVEAYTLYDELIKLINNERK